MHWLQAQISSNFACGKGWNGELLLHRGWPSLILNTSAVNVQRENITGPLSVFMNLSGESFVKVDNRIVRIGTGYFFISNQQQPYSLYIESKKAETFNIHFGDHFIKDAFQSLQKSPAQLLESPLDENQVFHCFFNQLHAQSAFMINFKDIIKRAVSGQTYNSLMLDELLFDLLKHLIIREKEDHTKFFALPVVQNGTREAIKKVLLESVDYMHTNYHRTVTLDEIAANSCLSKFHFLRLFSFAYGITPYQVIKQIRLNKAKELLRYTDLSVDEIAMETGIENASSLSRLFRQQTGAYPRQFRRSFVK